MEENLNFILNLAFWNILKSHLKKKIYIQDFRDILVEMFVKMFVTLYLHIKLIGSIDQW
jgi:hypothetical protein